MRTYGQPSAPSVTSLPGRRAAVVGLLAVGLALGACAGDSPPGPGGSPSGPDGGRSDPLPTTDDVLGLPEDAFERLERSNSDALWTLGRLSLDEVVQIEQAALEDGEVVLGLYPGHIRIYYTDDTMEDDEYGEMGHSEWVLFTSDGATVGMVALQEPSGQPEQTRTHPTAPELPASVLAEWEIGAAEAARIATELSPGEIEQVGVPGGIDRPLTTVVLWHEDDDGSYRERVTIDAVTGEPLNQVRIG